MKVSAYTVDLTLDDERGMLYNTLSREYYVYQKSQSRELWNFLAHLNHGIHCLECPELFEQLHRKHIIVQEDEDEQEELRYLQNVKRYASDQFYMTIFATNGCNLKCSYCEQNHITTPMFDSTMDHLLRFIEDITTKVKTLYIDWMGGEPLLEYERICRIMEKASKICEQNACRLNGKIITNGYLLDNKKLRRLEQANIAKLQITLEGNRDNHNSKRKDAWRQDTYDIIVNNMQQALIHGMQVFLQVNMDEAYIDEKLEVLEEIPKRYRSMVFVNFINAPWNQVTVSMYEHIKWAMDLGYECHIRYNEYVKCHACLSNSMSVNTDGAVLLCHESMNGEHRIGHLSEQGEACIENAGQLYKLRNVSALDNHTCKECQELPLCMGDCRIRRIQDNSACVRRPIRGLTLKEMALLDYYFDERKKSSVKVAEQEENVE